MKRIYISLLAAFAWIGVHGQDTTTDRPLTITKQGSFTVGGTVLQRPGTYDNHKFISWGTPVEQGQTYHADHAVVDFQIPVEARQLPLVFVHGYGQSGRCWQMTPDGRESFQTLMLRQGFGSYVVDMPGRGRSGRTTAETVLKPKADEQLWFDIFRIGEWPSFNPGVQFPTDSLSLDQFFRQMTPDISAHDMKIDLTALDALFDRIGNGIIVTHSAGGFPGWLAAIENQHIQAVVSYEREDMSFPKMKSPTLCQASQEHFPEQAFRWMTL